MTLSGGDRLASGQKTAQFGGAGNFVTEFESDFIFKSPAEVCKKYGITGHEYQQYDSERQRGDSLPDLQPVGAEQVKPSFTVTDRRSQFLPNAGVVEAKVSKYPIREYRPFSAILDRILVKRIETDPDLEELEDGSARSKRTGLVIAARYRQHNNKGIVLSVGNYIGIGGQCIPLSNFVSAGDLVTFGSYNTEKFEMNFKQAKDLCHSLGIDHEEGDEPFQILRLQDVRGVEKFIVRVKLVTNES
jgi:co-chaperonin GroES (HSP10)